MARGGVRPRPWACHGAWCWRELAKELRRRGHAVAAPDLPIDDPTGTLERYAEAVGSHPGAVVVGHSYGGLVIPLVEARLHVYRCALVPVPRRPSAELYPEATHPDLSGTERDELGRTHWPSLDLAAERLYRGYERQWAEWAYPQLRPHAQRAAQEPYPRDSLPEDPVAYVLAAGDRSVRPEWSRTVAERQLGVEPVEISGGHSPMLDRSRELADVLEALTA